MAYSDEDARDADVRKHWIALGGMGIGFVLSHLFGLAIFIPLLGLVVGFIFMHQYAKTFSVDVGWVKIVSWLNLVAWFLPIIGTTTAGISLGAATKSEEKASLYKILGIIGLVASLANAAWGIWLAQQAPVQ